MAQSTEQAPSAERAPSTQQARLGAVREAARGKRLLVTIPALDEERTVGDVIRGVPAEIPGISSIDVVLVNDGSRDRTGEVAREAGAHVIDRARSLGVGAAFQAALRYAIGHGADLIVNIDADGQFDPADIPRLIAPVLAGEADLASASRFKDPALVPRMPPMKAWGNRVLARLVSRLTGQRFHDVSCGFRCYSRRAALHLHLIGRFTYVQEVFLNLAFKQLRIVEVPLRVRGEREHGESRIASSLWKYALRTGGIILRCYRDYQPMRLFGFAAALLAVPGLLLGAFLTGHYLLTGAFTPYKWTGFAAVALVALGFLLLQTGLVGDMLNRHRIYLEELLYEQRLETQNGEDPRGR